MKYESRYFHIISMLPAHISMPPAITFGETGSFSNINANMIAVIAANRADKILIFQCIHISPSFLNLLYLKWLSIRIFVLMLPILQFVSTRFSLLASW